MATVLEEISPDEVVGILKKEFYLDTKIIITNDVPFKNLGLEPIDLLALSFYSKVRAGDYFSGEALNEAGKNVFNHIAQRRGVGQKVLEGLNGRGIDGDELLGYLTPEIWAEFVNYTRGYHTA